MKETVQILDPHQLAAVDHGDGPAIVLAGPGSGKTRVVVSRATRLIDDGHVRPEELLVLTFSRKAASDLRQRLADGLRRSYASFPVTTFHSFCFSLLLAAHGLGTEARAPGRAAPAHRAGIGGRRTGSDLPRSNALVAEALAFCALADDYLEAPDHPLATVRDRYRADLDSLGALDYGGLQREAESMLRGDDELRTRYANAFRYVLVDEYQDTNVAQDRLLHLIAGEHRNVFVVADEDQSIYGFRGAELENTLRFEETWPGAIRYDLPTNYRSAPAIVDLATSVIRRNVDSHRGKALAAAEARPARVVGRTFRHAAEEADWIAREIAALRLDGVALGEIAILGAVGQGDRAAPGLRASQPRDRLPRAIRLPASPDRGCTRQPHRTGAPRSLAARRTSKPRFAPSRRRSSARIPCELRPISAEQRTLYGSLRDAGGFEPFFQALGIVKRQKTAGAAVYALWERLDYFRRLQETCRNDPRQEDVEELAAVTALSDAANEFDGPLADFPAAFRRG